MKPRMTRRRRRVAVATLFLAYAVFAATGCGADRIILGENHQVVDPGAAERRTLKVDGRDVEYWVTRSPGARTTEPRATVLYFTGKASRAERWVGVVAESWGDRPVEMWAMNYPGSGGSEGPVRLAGVGPSALAVYDAARAAAPDRPILIEGGSFGTTAALCVAARRSVAGIVLKNPPALRELIMGDYGWWNLGLLAWPVARAVPQDLDSIANARRSTAPALILSAGKDWKVPPRYHRMIVDAYAGPKRVFDAPEAGHDDPLRGDQARPWDSGLDWVWNGAGLRTPAEIRK